MVRHARLTLSLLCLTLSILFAAFWARSYFYRDWFVHRLPTDATVLIASTQGSVDWSWVHSLPAVPNEELGARSITAKRWAVHKQAANRAGLRLQEPNFLGFGFAHHPGLQVKLWIPYWFLTLTSVVLALAISLPPRFRFSLRRLLIVVTIAALALGGMAALPAGR